MPFLGVELALLIFKILQAGPHGTLSLFIGVIGNVCKGAGQRSGSRSLLQRARQPQLSRSSAASEKAARFKSAFVLPIMIMSGLIPEQGILCKTDSAVAPKEWSDRNESDSIMIFWRWHLGFELISKVIAFA